VASVITETVQAKELQCGDEILDTLGGVSKITEIRQLPNRLIEWRDDQEGITRIRPTADMERVLQR
jgi:hypothetical protein